MQRLSLFAIAALVGSSATADAAAPRFQWNSGDLLTYTVRQSTVIRQSVPNPEGGGTTEGQTVTKLGLVKRWRVAGVDADGVATLILTVPALRMEIVPGGQQPIVFDSSKPDESDADLAKEMAQYINSPLAEILVDGRGRLVEVKSSRFGPASRLKADLPFKLVFPEGEITSPWSREYQIVMEPPHGAGETFDASQTYTALGSEGSIQKVGIKTELKTKATADEQIPLLPVLTEGEIWFDTQSGQYRGANLKIVRELTGHRGEGSTYRYESVYIEEAAQPR